MRFAQWRAMATIEHGEFSVEILRQFRDFAARSADRGDPLDELKLRSLGVHVLKGLGRVKEALVEGAALFPDAEQHFHLMPGRAQDQVVVGLRAAIGAAIARPEVAVTAVEASIVAFEQLCTRAKRPAGVGGLLRLQLRSTLAPTQDHADEVARLKQTIEASAQPLLCAECLSVRLAWHRRAHLQQGEISTFQRAQTNCGPERASHLIAEHHLANGAVSAAEGAYKRAVSKFSAAVLPVPLVCTGLAVAAASGGRRKVAARLRELDVALADYEYPYEAFEAVLLVERLRRAGLTPGKLPSRVERACAEAPELGAQLDARSPKTNATKRLLEVR